MVDSDLYDILLKDIPEAEKANFGFLEIIKKQHSEIINSSIYAHFINSDEKLACSYLGKKIYQHHNQLYHNHLNSVVRNSVRRFFDVLFRNTQHHHNNDSVAWLLQIPTKKASQDLHLPR